MRRCPQTDTMNVLEHGISVSHYYRDVLQHLRHNKPLKFEWKLPDWIYDDLILPSLLDDNTMQKYHIYHDCGKPFCLIYDEGKKHFPNHAQTSKSVFQSIFPNHYLDVSELIGRDMDIHLLKNDGVHDFSKSKYCLSLLLTGLAEIHSNAAMFGGIESTSFKIKWKHMNKRGKAILKTLKSKEDI
jgi:hypothetical protein